MRPFGGSPAEVLPDGSVVSGATAGRFRGSPARPPASGLSRAVVVRYAAADEAPGGVATVDAVLLRSGFGVRDAILSGGGAYRNNKLWTPEPATRDVRTGEAFDLARWDLFDPTALDGSRVWIAWEDDDPALPVCLGPCPTRATLRPPRSAAAADPIPADAAHPATPDGAVRYLEHQGTRVMVDRLGNVVVDTTEAPTSNAGTAVDPGTSPAGRVTLNLRASSELEVRVAGQRKVLVDADRVRLREGDRRVARVDDEAVADSSTDEAWARFWSELEGAINLLPVVPEDGGATLKTGLAELFGQHGASLKAKITTGNAAVTTD